MTSNEQVLHKPDWSDFRDHLATADQKGRRLWIYPKRPSGTLYRWRTLVSWLLLAILFAGPFIRINGNPLLMMNFVERKFVLFGQIFWPQDNYLFALAMLVAFIMIVLFTAVFGRVWCGWLCPQTVLMEMLFRKIEYAIDGDAHQQRALAAAPWTAGKIARRLTKHVIFFALSFVIGNLLLAYIIGSDALLQIITDPPHLHVKGLTAMTLFSLMFYGIFARFREQACTFICPYGRFQSVLLDENSIVVSYDHRRGDPRARFARELTLDKRRSTGIGDCIDCKLCVQVCPTGIDIRNGTQMECVNCTACIDACDHVMDKIGFPRGLIRYASQNNILKSEPVRFTARIAAYCTVLLLLGSFLTYLLATRTDVEASLLRSPGTLYQTLPNGDVNNIYLVKVMNKTSHDIPVELRLEQPASGMLTVAGGPLVARSQKMAESATVVQIPRDQLTGSTTPIVIGVYVEDKLIQRVKTGFLGPSKEG
jgi:cytochrome c oxidase accessory protein FixG